MKEIRLVIERCRDCPHWEIAVTGGMCRKSRFWIAKDSAIPDNCPLPDASVCFDTPIESLKANKE